MAKHIEQPQTNIPPQTVTPPQVTPELVKQTSLKSLSLGAGSVPVAPSTHVQITPIVQPMAFVPYSTLEQPLFAFDGADDYGIEADASVTYPDDDGVTVVKTADDYQVNGAFAKAEETEVAPIKKVKKGIKAAPIVLIILSLIVAAVFLLGKYVAQVETYCNIVDGKNGVDIIIDIYNKIVDKSILAMSNIVISAVTLVAVFTVLTFVASLIGICRKGASVFVKITTFFTLLFALIAIFVSLLQEVTMGIGLYIVAGVSLISLLIAYLAPKK